MVSKEVIEVIRIEQCHQCGSEGSGDDGTCDIPKHFVRTSAELEVEPAQLTVVPSYNEMISRRVDVHGRDPSAARRKRLEQLLFRQVIHPDVTLRLMVKQERQNTRTLTYGRGNITYGDEEVRLDWVKQYKLDGSLDFFERCLRVSS
jgi:hypothetical protein